jgi:hypothetical protein
VKTLFLRRPAALLTALTLAACAPGVDAPPSYRGGGAEPVGVSAAPLPLTPEDPCVDGDGDGYGRGCDLGEDCDDQDPTATDRCELCAVAASGCPCSPRDIPQPCDLDTDGTPSPETCWLGQRTCVQGAWSRCTAYAPRFH